MDGNTCFADAIACPPCPPRHTQTHHCPRIMLGSWGVVTPRRGGTARAALPYPLPSVLDEILELLLQRGDQLRVLAEQGGEVVDLPLLELDLLREPPRLPRLHLRGGHGRGGARPACGAAPCRRGTPEVAEEGRKDWRPSPIAQGSQSFHAASWVSA
eukprot:gene546-biopygen2192